MQIKPEQQSNWEKGIANNQDPYRKGIYDYAVKWADMMEAQLKEGALLKDIVSKTAHDVDTDGITGFMYGAAGAILSHAWIHGEELRQWHNLEFRLGTEGEKANKEGKVLNPAILCIS